MLFSKQYFLYLLSVATPLVNGRQYEFNPEDVLNQDPEKANPHTAVTCVGNIPDFDHISPPPDQAGEERTLQKLCAQAQHGGYRYPYNAGTLCMPVQTREMSEQKWAAVTRAGTTLEPTVYNHDFAGGFLAAPRFGESARNRLIAYCYLRCTCTGVDEPDRQPLRYEYKPLSTILDLARPFTSLFRPPEIMERRMQAPVAPETHWDHGRSLNLTRLSGSNDGDPLQRVGIDLLGIQQDNLVMCPASMPDFSLPRPATREMFDVPLPDFHDAKDYNPSLERFDTPLTRLCATTLSWGNERQNAGAYCETSRSDETKGRILFSDEMTPNVQWTFAPPSSANTPRWTTISALQLREYCARHCKCAKKGIETQEPPQHLFALLIVDRNNMRELKPGAGSPPDPRMAQRMWDPYEIALEFSKTPDGSDAAGDEAPEPQDDSREVEAAEAALVGSCSNTCTSTRDCKPDVAGGGPVCPSNRVCRVMGVWSGRGNGPPEQRLGLTGGLLGGMALFTRARCSTFTRNMRSRLGERDVNGVYCACNSTYVSAGCCESEDGILWEEPEQKIGVLSFDL